MKVTGRFVGRAANRRPEGMWVYSLEFPTEASALKPAMQAAVPSPVPPPAPVEEEAA